MERTIEQLCNNKAKTDMRNRTDLKLKTKRAARVARAKFFSHRVVKKWNKLPEDVVSAATVDNFKKKLDQHWDIVNLS